MYFFGLRSRGCITSGTLLHAKVNVMDRTNTLITSSVGNHRHFQAMILLACLGCVIILSGQKLAQPEPYRPAIQPLLIETDLMTLDMAIQSEASAATRAPEPKIASEPTLLELATAFIEPFEGRRHQAYRDSRGNMTIGVGFNLDRAGAADDLEKLLPEISYYALRRGDTSLNDTQIDTLLCHDTQRAIDTARRQIKNFDALPIDAQLILIDMTFNTGSLHKWRNLRSALTRSDYDAAADAMYRSLWRKQTGRRANHLIQMMRDLANS